MPAKGWLGDKSSAEEGRKGEGAVFLVAGETMSRNGRGSVDMSDVAVDIEGLDVEDRRSGMSSSRRLFHRHYNRLKEHMFDAYSPGGCHIFSKGEGVSDKFA